MMNDYRREYVWGAFLLRVSLGLLFFIAGLGKFIGGLAGIRGMINAQFAKSWLPPFFYIPFSYVLPFAEVILGALIILGLFRFGSLLLGSLLMLALTFGMMVLQNSTVAFSNLVYVALFAAAFFATPWDRLSLDTLLFRKNRPQGHL